MPLPNLIFVLWILISGIQRCVRKSRSELYFDSLSFNDEGFFGSWVSVDWRNTAVGGKFSSRTVCLRWIYRREEFIGNFFSSGHQHGHSVMIKTTFKKKWVLEAFRNLLRQDPLEAILVIFGRRAFFFVWKLLEKIEKWHHFCAHAQWRSPWRRKNVEKGHLAPSDLTFLLIAIDTNGFRRMKEEG